MRFSSSFQSAVSARVNYENLSVAEIMANYPPEKPCTDFRDYYKYVKKTMLRLGIAVYPTRFDHAENCIVCGEAGRCPGWHTMKEQREAGILEKQYTGVACYDMKPATPEQMEFVL